MSLLYARPKFKTNRRPVKPARPFGEGILEPDRIEVVEDPHWFEREDPARAFRWTVLVYRDGGLAEREGFDVRGDAEAYRRLLDVPVEQARTTQCDAIRANPDRVPQPEMAGKRDWAGAKRANTTQSAAQSEAEINRLLDAASRRPVGPGPDDSAWWAAESNSPEESALDLWLSSLCPEPELTAAGDWDLPRGWDYLSHVEPE